MKVGLVLEGGAMRGIYTSGVLDFLMENNIKVDEIIGVSAGALFGMNYKSKQIGRALRYNKKYVRNRNYMGTYSFITTGNVMNKDFCFNKLVNELDPVDFDTYKNSKENFYVVVTNIETGQAEYKEIDDLKNETQLEYLRASGSLPYVSKVVQIGNDKYLDGGISDSIPIEKMISLGCDKIIVVLTRMIDYRKKKGGKKLSKLYYRKYPKFINAIENRYKMYNNQVKRIIELEKQDKIFVIRPTRLIKMKRIEKDLNIIQDMYDLGRSDAENKFNDLKKYLLK